MLTIFPNQLTEEYSSSMLCTISTTQMSEIPCSAGLMTFLDKFSMTFFSHSVDFIILDNIYVLLLCLTLVISYNNVPLRVLYPNILNLFNLKIFLFIITFGKKKVFIKKIYIKISIFLINHKPII